MNGWRRRSLLPSCLKRIRFYRCMNSYNFSTSMYCNVFGSFNL
ncbi:unnamed protein product [Brugia timori]|uniref:Uncharacterized protein n=1 Tax=Brugia timori TaxID=42155 RepID=A0A0R3Q7A6_9BILA|nr:unnamed protein product [Brugia timori]